MPASTPIARSKTAALTRVTDSIPKGYSRYTGGTVDASKAADLAAKFHRLYGIGASPAQRLTRKSKGIANSILVMYWPGDAQEVQWLLLSTPGTGLEKEQMRDASQLPRLVWLGYELVRHSMRGRASWTWRRTKQEMADLYALLSEQLRRRQRGAVEDTLHRIARQPGFHGVREQGKALFAEVQRRGYTGEFPFLYYVQKVGHGDRLVLR